MRKTASTIAMSAIVARPATAREITKRIRRGSHVRICSTMPDLRSAPTNDAPITKAMTGSRSATGPRISDAETPPAMSLTKSIFVSFDVITT